MEYPHLGQHCSKETCLRLDFLPVKCDACLGIFCSNHMSYAKHDCPSAHEKNVQVPVCPLCNSPVPIERGTLPDIAVGNHIDNDCQSDKSKNKQVFANKCCASNCKIKEIVPVVCGECRLNFCFKHRHASDHDCLGQRRVIEAAALAREKRNIISRRGANENPFVASVHGNLSEDEALAKALQMSEEEKNNNNSRRRSRGRNQQQNCFVS